MAAKLKFNVTVRSPMKLIHWDIRAADLEEAAKLACKRCTLQKAIPMRTTGKTGEPGWFYPHGPNPKWPFVGNRTMWEPIALESPNALSRDNH